MSTSLFEPSSRSRIARSLTAQAILIAFLCALLGGLLAWSRELYAGPEYRATAQFVVNATGVEAASGSPSVDLLDRRLQTELSRLNAPDLVATALTGADQEAQVTASQVGNTDVVQIAAVARSADEAQGIASRLISAYSEARAEEAEQAARQAENLLNLQVARVSAQPPAGGSLVAKAERQALLEEVSRLAAEVVRWQAHAVSRPVELVQAPGPEATNRTSSPARGTLIGAFLGLIVAFALLLILVRRQ